MIVYLGMPKCASTWLWEKIKHNFDYNGLKEPHTLVEWGTSNGVIDFSTNNWSMDSSTVRSIDFDSKGSDRTGNQLLLTNSLGRRIV
jgi:hypothetical protein